MIDDWRVATVTERMPRAQLCEVAICPHYSAIGGSTR
jgi:hypothetical protein